MNRIIMIPKFKEGDFVYLFPDHNTVYVVESVESYNDHQCRYIIVNDDLRIIALEFELEPA